MIAAGIDAGSRAIKVVLFDPAQSRIVSSGVAEQGVDPERRVTDLLEKTLRAGQIERGRVGKVVATGYGRHAVRFADTTVTEITCQARGVRHWAPEARSIVEIGGQDSKILRLEENGQVRDFAMNERCAAGTGRFLEMLTDRLGIDWDELGKLSSQSELPAPISSICVVFAETEIIGLLAEGRRVADVAAGVQRAIASRVVALAGRPLEPPAYFTGGVALQPGMRQALTEALGIPLSVPPQPQSTGALGAAILAGEGI